MKKKTLLTVICTFLATSLIWISVYNCTMAANPVVKKVADAYSVIKDNYIFEFDEEYVKDLAVAAMVMGLGDKYSQFYSKEYYQSLQESMDGHYYGIGIVVKGNAETNEIVVNEVNEDSPAQKAGILPGDIMIEVEDTPVNYSNYQDAVNLIKSDENDRGTEVKIKLIRAETGVQYTVWVKREKIINHTVSLENVGDGIAYIKISSFDNETPSDFYKEIDNFGIDKIRGIILDLRDNGGGTLYATHTIADMLMPEAVLTTFKYKDGTTNDVKTTNNRLLNVPICILVNGNSASASEVLTSGLRDNGIAKVVGEQTFGKAIAQRSFPFETENGEVVSSLYLTNARYLTPNGENIHEIGIKPDYIVETPEEYKEIPVKEWKRENDTQYKKAYEVIKKELK